MSNHKKVLTSLLNKRRAPHERSLNTLTQLLQLNLGKGLCSTQKKGASNDVHWITQEMTEASAKNFHDAKLKRQSSLETTEGTISDNLFAMEKERFLKHLMEKQLTKSVDEMTNDSLCLQQQQREQLDYVTFRLIKSDQKMSLQKLKSSFSKKRSQNDF